MVLDSDANRNSSNPVLIDRLHRVRFPYPRFQRIRRSFMTDLASQIEDVRSEMGRTTSQILSVIEKATREVQRVSDRSLAIVREAVIAGAIREEKLHKKLAKLEVMAKLQPDDEEAPRSAKADPEKPPLDQPNQPKRSASEIILFKLASSRQPVPTGDLDEIVIEEGLTKSAAEKAKYHLKKDGLATASKRRWSITDAGRKKLNGHHPPGGP
ncbi:hypothetical protein [Hansschlegelia sp. KR7-227]|uniref:hypothetical protein n=1 Tax=Hansschlegelia sp. KR7-227 TaxID=3400914 RepID=UPI003C0F75A3